MNSKIRRDIRNKARLACGLANILKNENFKMVTNLVFVLLCIAGVVDLCIGYDYLWMCNTTAYEPNRDTRRNI